MNTTRINFIISGLLAVVILSLWVVGYNIMRRLDQVEEHNKATADRIAALSRLQSDQGKDLDRLNNSNKEVVSQITAVQDQQSRDKEILDGFNDKMFHRKTFKKAN